MEILGGWELLGQVGLQCPVHWIHDHKFRHTDLAVMGACKLQDFLVVGSSKQAVDSGQTTSKGLAEPISMPPLQMPA
jgi:hypothetical protein